MQRLRQDISYVGQGFIVSLTMMSVVLLLAAAIALVLVTLMPGSLGAMLRELFPPGTLMAQLTIGGIAISILLWGLSYIHYLPKKLSVRLRWFIGIFLGITLFIATLVNITSSAAS